MTEDKIHIIEEAATATGLETTGVDITTEVATTGTRIKTEIMAIVVKEKKGATTIDRNCNSTTTKAVIIITNLVVVETNSRTIFVITPSTSHGRM